MLYFQKVLILKIKKKDKNEVLMLFDNEASILAIKHHLDYFLNLVFKAIPTFWFALHKNGDRNSCK